jgi:hypothetical protein
VIADLDEVLRDLLIREIDIKDNEVDITFDQPKREWSARLSKPTLNLFLFDVRENLRLRGAEQYSTITRPDGNSEIRRNPVRMALRYLLTAWVKEPEDEHLLLSNAMMGFLRNPFIPIDQLPERFQSQPMAIPIEVATFHQEEGPVDKFTEIWGVLDNEMRPGIVLTVTISVDPYRPQVFPQVHTRQTRFVQDTPSTVTRKAIDAKPASKTYWSVGGTIKSEKYTPATLALVLVEKQTQVDLSDEGNFVLHGVVEGDYHLDILYNKKVLKRQKIRVPAPNYEISV